MAKRNEYDVNHDPTPRPVTLKMRVRPKPKLVFKHWCRTDSSYYMVAVKCLTGLWKDVPKSLQYNSIVYAIERKESS